VIADHRQAATRRERGAEGLEGPRESAKFVIHRDPEPLKDPGKLTRARPRAQDGANGVDQIIARRKAGALPSPHDLPRHRAGLPLVGVVPEDRHQFTLRQLVQQVRRRRPAGAHAHVQRNTRSEAETAAIRIELPRRDTEIQKDKIRCERRHGLERCGRRIRRLQPRDAGLTESPPGGRECIRIPVDPRSLTNPRRRPREAQLGTVVGPTVLASCPVARAKSRICRGLTTATGSLAPDSVMATVTSYPPVASRTTMVGVNGRMRAISVTNPASSWLT